MQTQYSHPKGGTFTLLADIWHALQSRYFMGQTGRSYIVGLGTRPPVYIYEEASSCPKSSSTTCDASTGLLNPNPNPWVVQGAIVRGPINLDPLIDSRLSYQTVVQVRSSCLIIVLTSVREASCMYMTCTLVHVQLMQCMTCCCKPLSGPACYGSMLYRPRHLPG